MINKYRNFCMHEGGHEGGAALVFNSDLSLLVINYLISFIKGKYPGHQATEKHEKLHLQVNLQYECKCFYDILNTYHQINYSVVKYTQNSPQSHYL